MNPFRLKFVTSVATVLFISQISIAGVLTDLAPSVTAAKKTTTSSTPAKATNTTATGSTISAAQQSAMQSTSGTTVKSSTASASAAKATNTTATGSKISASQQQAMQSLGGGSSTSSSKTTTPKVTESLSSSSGSGSNSKSSTATLNDIHDKKETAQVKASGGSSTSTKATNTTATGSKISAAQQSAMQSTSGTSPKSTTSNPKSSSATLADIHDKKETAQIKASGGSSTTTPKKSSSSTLADIHDKKEAAQIKASASAPRGIASADGRVRVAARDISNFSNLDYIRALQVRGYDCTMYSTATTACKGKGETWMIESTPDSKLRWLAECHQKDGCVNASDDPSDNIVKLPKLKAAQAAKQASADADQISRTHVAAAEKDYGNLVDIKTNSGQIIRVNISTGDLWSFGAAVRNGGKGEIIAITPAPGPGTWN